MRNAPVLQSSFETGELGSLPRRHSRDDDSRICGPTTT
jgi:hypothetical protein